MKLLGELLRVIVWEIAQDWSCFFVFFFQKGEEIYKEKKMGKTDNTEKD